MVNLQKGYKISMKEWTVNYYQNSRTEADSGEVRSIFTILVKELNMGGEKERGRKVGGEPFENI